MQRSDYIYMWKEVDELGELNGRTTILEWTGEQFLPGEPGVEGEIELDRLLQNQIVDKNFPWYKYINFSNFLNLRSYGYPKLY